MVASVPRQGMVRPHIPECPQRLGAIQDMLLPRRLLDYVHSLGFSVSIFEEDADFKLVRHTL